MNIKQTIVLAVFFSFSTSVFADDQHGCYSATSACLQIEAISKSPDKLSVKYTNVCGGRVLISACNEFKSGNEDCGMFGLRPGSSHTWTSYGKTTGRYNYGVTGSRQSSKDGICSSNL